MGEMVKIQKEGLVKHIGVSNFDLTLLKAAMEIGRVEVVQNEYSLLHRNIEKDLLPFCFENNCMLIGNRGLLMDLVGLSYNFKNKEHL
jgi:diketogulonate reductase-like aldo/keto reductase